MGLPPPPPSQALSTTCDVWAHYFLLLLVFAPSVWLAVSSTFGLPAAWLVFSDSWDMTWAWPWHSSQTSEDLICKAEKNTWCIIMDASWTAQPGFPPVPGAWVSSFPHVFRFKHWVICSSSNTFCTFLFLSPCLLCFLCLECCSLFYFQSPSFSLSTLKTIGFVFPDTLAKSDLFLPSIFSSVWHILTGDLFCQAFWQDGGLWNSYV